MANHLSRRTLSTSLIITLAVAPVASCCATPGLPQDSTNSDAPGTMTGSWPARLRAEERGVIPFGELTTEVWANVDGGLQRHAWINGLLDFGVELDTSALGWWEGGRFQLQAHWVQNLRNDGCFSDYTGAFNPVSGIEAGDHFRIFNVNYQHSWWNETLALKLGQIAVDDDFMLSDYGGLFMNSAFGAMPSQVGTPLATSCGNLPAFPIYSVAAPGLFVKVRPVTSIYSQVGVYFGKPGMDDRDNYGFDWANDAHDPELGLLWESGYTFELGSHSATTRGGISYHTGPLDDFTQKAKVPQVTRQTVPNFYLIQDLGVIANDDGSTRLGIFGRVGLTPEPDRSMIGWYVDGGFNWFSPFPGRKDDVAGIAFSHTRFGADFLKSTGPVGIAESETALEITYRSEITKWMFLQADVQILLDPAVDPDLGSRETATVLGMRAQVRF